MSYLDSIFISPLSQLGNVTFVVRGCLRWKILKHNDIPLEKWLKIIKNLKRNFSSDVFVEFNGGEPLLRKSAIIRMVKELKTHFKRVVLNTNGFLLDEKPY